MPGPDPRKARLMQGPKSGVGKQSRLSPEGKKKKDDFIIVLDDKYISDPNKLNKIFMIKPEKKAKGGRAGYRMGGKCKLAKKGKGRAYGKNS
jgi:hypothetical protein